MSKTVKMKLNRKYRLASTMGHVIVFPAKDVEIDVPEAMVREAVDIGAEFCDEKAREAIYKEEEGEPATPVNPKERKEDIISAIGTIEDKNDRDDFTATGNPKLKAVEAVIGYKIDKGELAEAMKARNEDQ